ncbi:putative host specificity protein, partial [Escherichia coli EC1846]
TAQECRQFWRFPFH